MVHGLGTVGELLEQWFALTEPGLSPAVAVGYRHILDRRLLPRWGDVPLEELRPVDLDIWYVELRRNGARDGGPLQPNTVARIHAVLRRALAQGVEWGLVETNAAARATPPRARKQALVLPSPADVARLIEVSAKVNPLLPVYLRLAATTGARRGELCALRWRHVDLERRRLTIARGIVIGPGRVWVEKDTKTHQVRALTLDDTTVAILSDYRATRAAGPAAFVFSHAPDGSTPLRPDYLTLAFRRLCAGLGLEGVRLHHLRHFSATQLLALGIDLRTVSGRLGHANPSTTLDIYAQFVEQADERAAAVIASALDEA